MIWRKSSYSAYSDCVELAECSAGCCVHVRNSRHPNTEYMTVTKGELAAFFNGVKAGEFDDLAELA